MALETKAYGLRARKSDIGGNAGLTIRVPVSSSYGTALYAGDVVTLNAGNAELVSNTAATQGAAQIVGVVSQVAYIDPTLGTPRITKVLPASTAAGSAIDGSTTPWVDVEVTQGAQFEVLALSASGMTAANSLGKYFGLITNGTPDSVLNVSAVSLQPLSGATYGTTAGGTAAKTDRTVQFVGIVQEPGNDWGATNLKCIVRFVNTPINT